MKEFFIYFFGKSETEEFANFTFAHAAPILVAIAIILLLAKFGGKYVILRVKNTCATQWRFVL